MLETANPHLTLYPVLILFFQSTLKISCTAANSFLSTWGAYPQKNWSHRSQENTLEAAPLELVTAVTLQALEETVAVVTAAEVEVAAVVAAVVVVVANHQKRLEKITSSALVRNLVADFCVSFLPVWKRWQECNCHWLMNYGYFRLV